MAHEVSDRERQTIDNLTYVWNLKKTTQKQRVNWGLPGMGVLRGQL